MKYCMLTRDRGNNIVDTSLSLSLSLSFSPPLPFTFSLLLKSKYTKFTLTLSLTHFVNSLTDLGIVECIATADCSGEVLGNMTTFNCCIEEDEGFAFRIPGSDTCHVCIGMYE